MKVYQKIIGALVIGVLLLLPGIASVAAQGESEAERDIRMELILGTRVTNAPVYMGKQVQLETSYGKRSGGEKIIRPAKVRFYHDGMQIGQSRGNAIFINHNPPVIKTWGITMPREEGPYAIQTCVESGNARKCSDVTVDVRNLVKDKFVVSGPTVRQDPDDEGWGYIQASIRNDDDTSHWASVYLYYSEDDELSGREDIRMFYRSYRLDANGGSVHLERRTVPQSGYYFLRVNVDRSDEVYSVRHVLPPTVRALDISLSETSTSANRAEFDLRVSNPREGSLAFYTWLAKSAVIDEPPYLVFRDLSYTSRRVSVAGESTSTFVMIDAQAGNPDRITSYIACAGPSYGDRVKCSKGVFVSLED